MNEERTNPALTFLGEKLRLLGDLMAVNLLWIVFSLPIITIGAASSAAYAVLLRRIRRGEGSLFKSWIHAFRQNFKQATILGLIGTLTLILLWGDLQMITAFEGGLRIAYMIVSAGIFFIAATIFLFAIPQQALFQNTLPEILKNAFALAFCNPGKYLKCCFYWAIPIGSALLLPWEVVDKLGFFWVLWGLSAPAWFTSTTLLGIFSGFDSSLKESEDKKHES